MTKKAKLIIDGKEIEVEITQEQLDKLCPPKKKTGYERTKKNEKFYFISAFDSEAHRYIEKMDVETGRLYLIGNYHSNKTLAENNARADKLMRQLRRFAVEHRKNPIDWTSPIANLHEKWEIMYSCPRDAEHKLFVTSLMNTTKGFGRIYFDELSTAELAIETFKDELLWYFTEYKDSL